MEKTNPNKLLKNDFLNSLPGLWKASITLLFHFKIRTVVSLCVRHCAKQHIHCQHHSKYFRRHIRSSDTLQTSFTPSHTRINSNFTYFTYWYLTTLPHHNITLQLFIVLHSSSHFLFLHHNHKQLLLENSTRIHCKYRPIDNLHFYTKLLPFLLFNGLC